jgi:hypothetical protein
MQPPARHGDGLPADALDCALGALPAPTRDRHRDCLFAIVFVASKEQVASRGRGGLGHGEKATG